MQLRKAFPYFKENRRRGYKEIVVYHEDNMRSSKTHTQDDIDDPALARCETGLFGQARCSELHFMENPTWESSLL